MNKLPLLALFLLAACQQNPATGNPMFTLASPAEVRATGEAAAKSTLVAEGIYRPTSEAAQYVTTLCNKIYAVTEAAADAVQCNLTDDGAFNAFATPGYLFINRGLLPFISSESELAAVIGHEAGHLNARHIATDITHTKITDLMRGVAVAAVADEGYDAAQTAATVGQQASEIGLMTFSRAHEMQADALGRRYMEKAGYDPREGLTMVRALNGYDLYTTQQSTLAFGAEQPSLLARLKSSHPSSPERIAAALAATGEPPAMAPAEDLNRQRYMAAINGLAYGPARRYGIARKTELVLTKQRLTLPLPAGTTTDYLSSNDHDLLGTWLIGNPQSGVYLRLTSLKLTTGRNPGTLLQTILPMLHTPVTRIVIGQNTPVEDTSPTTTLTDEESDAALDDQGAVAPRTVIGYTSTYHYLNSPHTYRAVAFGAATRQDEMLLLTIIYPNEAVMKLEDTNTTAILGNIRFLTRTQSLAYKPLQILTFTAAAGDSVAHQATQLPMGALQENLFRALNNLPAPQEMQTGQLYKTVIDPNP